MGMLEGLLTGGYSFCMFCIVSSTPPEFGSCNLQWNCHSECELLPFSYQGFSSILHRRTPGKCPSLVRVLPITGMGRRPFRLGVLPIMDVGGRPGRCPFCLRVFPNGYGRTPFSSRGPPNNGHGRTPRKMPFFIRVLPIISRRVCPARCPWLFRVIVTGCLPFVFFCR